MAHLFFLFCLDLFVWPEAATYVQLFHGTKRCFPSDQCFFVWMIEWSQIFCKDRRDENLCPNPKRFGILGHQPKRIESNQLENHYGHTFVWFEFTFSFYIHIFHKKWQSNGLREWVLHILCDVWAVHLFAGDHMAKIETFPSHWKLWKTHKP